MTSQESTFSSIGRAPSLVERVVEELTEAIVSGRFERGQRLPAERDLGEQFGVSRTVVREAIRSLSARNLVTVTSGRGVEVAGIDASAVADSMRMYMRGESSFDYEQIHEFRNVVEVATATLAARRATDEDVAQLGALCNTHEKFIAAGNLPAASKVDFDFHRELARASGNPLFLIVLDSVDGVLRDVRDRAYSTPGVAQDGLRDHREILSLVAAHDESGAGEAMARHLVRAEAVQSES